MLRHHNYVQLRIVLNHITYYDIQPIMCNTVYEESPQGTHLRHDEQPEVEPIIIGMPQLQPWW